MAELVKVDLTRDAPKQLCLHCAAENALHHQPTGVDVVYCEHERVGARRVGEKWDVYTNMGPQDFKALICLGLAGGVTRIAEREAKRAGPAN